MSRTLTPLQSARAGLALARANVRYWTAIAPLTRVQLARWEKRARTIADPSLRALASSKLREERFNVEVAATLATLAPPPRRRHVVEAIVALQVMYDYLDVLTEQPLPDQLRASESLFEAFTDAFGAGTRHLSKRPGRDEAPLESISPENYYRDHPCSDDDNYLRELACTVRVVLARLPGTDSIVEVAQRGARRCVEAQILSHADVHAGSRESELWARREAPGTGLGWPELLAGATASVLSLHALIAASADDRTTRAQARAIDSAYLAIGALTMLDSLNDREQDLAMGEQGYIRHYENREQMAASLATVARQAADRARATPHPAHHTMTLVGVVAYYGSAKEANNAFAKPVVTRVVDELKPLIGPTLAVMRAWRLAKSIRPPSRDAHTTRSYEHSAAG